MNNINHGQMIGSAQGRGNEVTGNTIITGPDETRKLTADLLARLDQLTDALGTAPEMDENTRILAEHQVRLLRKATGSTPADRALISTRWADLRDVLAGLSTAGTSVAGIVEAIGSIVRALAGS